MRRLGKDEENTGVGVIHCASFLYAIGMRRSHNLEARQSLNYTLCICLLVNWRERKLALMAFSSFLCIIWTLGLTLSEDDYGS